MARVSTSRSRIKPEPPPLDLLDPNPKARQGPDGYRLLKVNRLRFGGKPRVLDLFAGCGGLSLGFHRAGFDIVGSVESDPIAAESHAINFHNSSQGERALHSRPRDITTIEPHELVSELNLGSEPATAVDVIVGGPPCQAFARVGRAKLREVAAHPEAFKQDDRGNLYLRYLHYVKMLKPLILLMENVPDVLNYGGHNISQEICDVLAEYGYRSRYTLLNAAFYGVPQMRERMFLIAYANELECEVDFPSPSHWIDLPRGYEGSRQVAFKLLSPSLFRQDAPGSFVPPPVPSSDSPPAITAKEALADLPKITIHLDGEMRRGARRLDSLISYTKTDGISDYAMAMRSWPGFENSEGVYDHVIRSLPRDYAIFRRMNPGDQYPEAYEHAMELFRARVEAEAQAGKLISPDSPEYHELFRAMIPPYDAGKFPNKWRKRLCP